MVAGGTALQLGLIVATVAGLWLGARLLVDTVIRLARRLGLSELTIGLTVVAAGTSAPELVVSVDAALANLGAIAVGNVVGSNVYNLAFILGVVSLVRVVPIERSLVHRDGIVLVVSTLLGGAVLFDGGVSRLEGALLVGLFVAYTGYLLLTTTETSTTSEPSSGADAGGSAEARDDAAATDLPNAVSTALTERVTFRGRDALLLVVGLGVVLVSGDLLVGAASTLARGAGVSDLVIGSTIVAAGTSTPEFAVSLVAMRRGRIGVSVGNIFGSNVFNLLGIMGLSAVVRPLSVGSAVLDTVAWLTVISVLMVAALWTGRQLSRVEGGLFATSEVARWLVGLLG